MSSKLLRIKDISPFLARELKDLFYDENEIAALARIIIKTIFRGSGLHQVYNSSTLLNSDQSLEVSRFCSELRTGKPYQYITGETEFLDCRLKVKPGVLIPRPETEELADMIIRENRSYKGNIADFGTGSGCIAVALAKGIPGAKVTGYDVSVEALEIASENATINKADAAFEKFDILRPGTKPPGPAGIIVSNPPYVLNSEKAHMRKNVLEFEPPLALFVDDNDPLVFYRKIAEISADILEKKGRIYFEINESMGAGVASLLSARGFTGISIVKDLHEKDRFVKATKP
ncbi:MAG TPA: peptide chain release factor N(5)-glutamine methyltransferase [Bacteroidales bacterium]|jgi:release factor glutamine methyltransferase|nr:peptide chain release factor N(5)-glutamine methyltransferase [Bacteroidales bacterium]